MRSGSKALPGVRPARVDTAAARALQLALREQLILHPPAGFAPRTVGGADISMRRFGTIAFGGIVVLGLPELGQVCAATAVVPLTFPYVPGLLSFRELPVLEAVWPSLPERPDVLIFDGHGTAHPRRFGLACHGGLTLGTPSIGCAKALLVGKHGELAPERGATSDIVLNGEVVGRAVRTRAGVKPVYVSPGHLVDLDTAVDIVLRAAPRFREPETTRAAHRLVNQARRAGGE
jgi:deoxyribonuclease V